MNSPHLDALIAYVGKFEKKLFSTLLNGLEASEQFTVISNVKNALNLTKLKVADGIRPYVSSGNPGNNDLQYSGRKLEVSEGMRVIPIEPIKYRETWMSEVMKGGVNPKDIPFAAYVMQAIIDSVKAELNDKTTGYGFDSADAVLFDAGETYAAGDYITFGTNPVNYYKAVATTSAGESPTTHPAKWQIVNAEAITKGMLTLIEELIDDSALEPITTGAITASNAYANFKKMWRALPPVYRMHGANIYCSWNAWDNLFDDFEDKIGKYTDTDQAGNMWLRGTGRKARIVPATWMGDSGRVIVTPKENLLMGTDLLSDLNRFHFKEHMFTIDVGLVFALGFQIRDLEAIKVNDVA